MRFSSFRQIEAFVKRYAKELIIAILASVAAIFRDWFVEMLRQVAVELLSQFVFWSTLAALSGVLLFALYFYKSRVLEREVLKHDPHFYDHYEFDQAFDEAIKKKP
jgi:di/tricarboxylate transporter